MIAEGHRASEIISRIRTLAKKAPPQKDWLDLNQTIGKVIAMARSAMQRNRVSLQTQLANDLPVTDNAEKNCRRDRVADPGAQGAPV